MRSSTCMITCSKCHQAKPETEFLPRADRPKGYRSLCKFCMNESTRKRRHGIEHGEYERMLHEQGGLCAICGTDEPNSAGSFHVDHDHETGKVRGLLCNRCNTRLGTLEIDGWLNAARGYLAKHGKPL